MRVVTQSKQELEALYLSTKKSVCDLIVERCRRFVEDPEIYLAPDERDRELASRIVALRLDLARLHPRYLSARGEYLTIGCYAGEHNKCRREIKRESALLVCSCDCHNKTEGGKSGRTTNNRS